MWAIVNGSEGPYEVEKMIDEYGGLVQVNGTTWFIRAVELFPTKENAEEALKGKRVPWPKGGG